MIERPCIADHPEANAATALECVWCRLALTDPWFQRAFGLSVTAPDPDPPPSTYRALRCVHLGEALGELAECSSCGGRVRLKVLACAVHGRALERMHLAGLACCATCPDYVRG